MAKKQSELFDFSAFGKSIKAARTERKESRKDVSEAINISPRYLTNIENNGQQPSLQILYELATRYQISVDQFFFPNQPKQKSTARRQLDALLDDMSEDGLLVLTAAATELARQEKQQAGVRQGSSRRRGVRLIELRCGEIAYLPGNPPVPGQVLKSENAYIASVLQTGKVIANAAGETRIWAEADGETLYEISCRVLPGTSRLPVLLNRFNAVPGPYGDLEQLPQDAVSGKQTVFLEHKTAEAFLTMVEAAKAENIWLAANFGYRSLEQQQKIIDMFTERDGVEAAMRRCAPVGFSEHHSGLALDVTGGVYQDAQNALNEAQVWKWVAENCHRFGFMLKNLPGKEHLTGTIYEPWHIRYLGDLQLCKTLHDGQLTLDEYLDGSR